MADKESDILRDAMIETDREIFGDAFGQESTVLDDTGDQSLEKMGDGLEGQHEPEENETEEGEEGEGEPEKVEAKAETKTDAKADPKVEDQPRLVPSSRLRDEGRRAVAAETERDALKARLATAETESAKKIDALRAEFMAALRQQPRPTDQPKPADPAKPPGPPDLFEDPKAYDEYVRNAARNAAAEEARGIVSKQLDDFRVNMSIENARVRHGPVFETAMEAILKLDANNPSHRDLGRQLRSAPNPGEAIVQWHRRNETLREVGDDPAAYKAKIAEDTRKALMDDPEFRKQLIADMRAEAMTGDDGRPRTATRLPPSLNRTVGGNSRAPNDLDAFDDSPNAVFGSAWT